MKSYFYIRCNCSRINLYNRRFSALNLNNKRDFSMKIINTIEVVSLSNFKNFLFLFEWTNYRNAFAVLIKSFRDVEFES